MILVFSKCLWATNRHERKTQEEAMVWGGGGWGRGAGRGGGGVYDTKAAAPTQTEQNKKNYNLIIL